MVIDTEAPWSVWHGDTRKGMPFSGIFGVGPEISQSVVLGSFMCFPYGLRNMGMIRLGLLILNEYGCKIVDILTRAYTTLGGV